MIRVHADNAIVHWLVDSDSAILTSEHGILYVPTINKLGQVTRDSAQGLSPKQAFVERYSGTGSNVNEDIEAVDIIVFPKIHGEKFAYDDAIRDLIHHLYKQGKIGFDALGPNYQVPGLNSEALVGYDRAQHLDQLISVIKQYFGLASSYDTRNALTWRWRQEQEIEEICEKLTQHQLCLYAAYTSRGKTKIAIEVAHRMLPQGGIVLVTTPITDTKQGFSDNLSQWHFGPRRNRTVTYMDSTEFKSVTVQELLNRVDQGELIFVVLTVQDLRWGESVENLDLALLRHKYQALDGNLDLWIRDERHSQYNGAVTSTRLGQLRARLELDLTATPYNCFDLYDPKHIVSRTLLWGLQNRNMTRLPQIGIDALSLAAGKVSDKIADLYTTAEGYDPRKMFVRDNGNFVLEAEIIELAQCFYNKTLSRHKNPLSINNDTNLSASAKRCGMWVLPAGSNGDGAGDYIPDMAALLNTSCGGHITWVDSYTLENQCPRGMSIGDYIQGILEKSHKRLVILTCGKFLTGTDIPALGHVVLFDKMSSIANFEQLMGRMIREWPEKEQVKLYALAPGADLQVLLGRMALKSSELSGGQPQDILDCVPLSEYREGNWNELTSEEVLNTVQTWFRDQVRRLIPGVSVLKSIQNLDLTSWRAVDLNNLKTMLPKARINEDIGSKLKVAKPRSAAREKGESDTAIPVDKIREIIQNVVFESQWVSYSMNNYNWREVFQNPALVEMFGQDVIQACVDTIQESPKLEILIRDHLATKQQAYANLPYTEIYDELFGNSKLKQSIGLVYVPLGLAREMVDNLKKKEYNKICVVNALNGILPLVLREAFPDAEITCAEVFPFFKEHLFRLGFKGVDWSGVDMKFDLVIGNPPYVDSSVGKIPIYDKFIVKSMALSTRIVALVIPSGFSTSNERNGDVVRQIVSSPSTSTIKFLDLDSFPGANVNTLYFVIDKDRNGPTCIQSNNKTYNVASNTGDYIFRNELLRNILVKCGVHDSSESWIKFNRIDNVTPTQSKIKTVSQITRSNISYDMIQEADAYINNHKVVTSLLPNSRHHLDVVWYVPPGIGVKKGYTVYKARSKKEAANMVQYLRSSLCRVIHSETKTSRSLRTPQLKFIPNVDLSKTWTDAEIYAHFKLTPEEIAYVENAVS